MDLNQWRTSPTHVAWMAGAFQDPLFKDMLELMTKHALGVTLPGQAHGGTGDYNHGKQAGKSEMLQILDLMRQPLIERQDPEITYGAPDSPEATT